MVGVGREGGCEVCGEEGMWVWLGSGREGGCGVGGERKGGCDGSGGIKLY